jgi:hypothetical protein
MTRVSRLAVPAALAAFVAFGCGGASPRGQLADGRTVAPAAPRWQSWGPDAFARARRENKLLLVGVSAGWCHWCHVMDAETYADPTVARLLADHFVAIRVDADARPDLAERYQRWGWPATAILTPDARPVLERKGFQPARPFAALLERLASTHAAGRPLAREPEPAPDAPPPELAAILQASLAQLDGFYDTREEGWGGPQKYPYAAPIEHAFFRAAMRDEPTWRERALATLERERRLVDPVWGGMFQYSVGGTWDEPHYEKIAAIQAGAIENAALAYRVTGDARWLDMAQGIRRYLVEFLRGPDGAFGSSQNADAPGMPGAAFYALGDADRRRAGAPRVDARVHADANGLIIRALCALYAATGDPDVLADAQRAADRLERTHRLADGSYTHAELAGRGGLRRDERGAWSGRAPNPGAVVFLADQVEMGRAFVALHEATGHARYRVAAVAVADALVSRFRDGARGALFESTADPHAVGVFAERRTPFLPNAGAARLFVALSAATGEARYREVAAEIVRAAATPAEVRRRGRTVGELILAIEELALRTVHVTIVAEPTDPVAQALRRAAMRLADPRRVVAWGVPGEQYPDIGRAAAYLCDDRSCSSPITDPARFAEQATRFLATL